MNTKTIIGAVAAVGILLAAAVFLLPAPSTDDGLPSGVIQATPAPDFTVDILDGKEVSLKDFRGKPLVINFWASWCPPCREEAPILAKVSKKYDNEVVFLGIIFQDTEEGVRSYIKEFDIPFQNAWDRKEEAAQAYKLTGVPETFFIDAEGNLKGRWIGAISEEKLTSLVELIK